MRQKYLAQAAALNNDESVEQTRPILVGSEFLGVGGVEATENVNVEDDALDPGEIVEGLREQVEPAGAEQVSEI
jgi:hypothetical protein